MIRSAAFIVILLSLHQLVAAQSLVDTPWIITSHSMNLAGKVDSLAELTLSVKVVEVASALQVTGDSGSKIITVPDTLLSVQEERAWKFDDKARLLSEVFRSASNKKAELRDVSSKNYEYKNRDIKYEVNRKDGSVVDSTAHVYSGGKISMLERYDGKGRYAGRKQFFQNKDRVLSTISNKNAGLELLDMTKLWYNEKGELTSATFHDNNQRLYLTKKYDVDIDSAGRKHIMIFDYAKPDTCTGMTSYLLDDAGNHLEDVVQDERGNVTYYTTAVANDYGHVTAQTVFKEGKLNITCTYEYDAYKNWTVKRIYHDGVPKTFVRRTLFYKE